jgi:MYXO-CTERM domain-containing protein
VARERDGAVLGDGRGAGRTGAEHDHRRADADDGPDDPATGAGVVLLLLAAVGLWRSD